jgi:glycosyltransferase involved in cell wall biosynthesis
MGDGRDAAVAHGRLTGDGGAQRVAIEAARALDAPLYALRVDESHVPDDIDARELSHGRVGRWLLDGGTGLPGKAYWLALHLYQMQHNAHLPELHEYDVVLQSKPEMGWYRQRDDQTVVRYCHHAYRNHYSQFHEGAGSLAKRLWTTAFSTAARQTVDYPELLAANSELTMQRYRDNFAVAPERLRLCYPPVGTERLRPGASGEPGGFHLHLGRLAANKRVPEVVRAFEGRDGRLVVAGDGSRRQEVEEAASGLGNVDVLGYVPEQKKRRLLAGADSLISNGFHEDFGITVVEAMASGTPVLGVDEPYTRHLVDEGATGYTYDRGRLPAALDRLEADGVSLSPEEMSERAEQFSSKRFRRRIRSLVDEAVERSRVEPRWQERAADPPEVAR